ncbi:Hypothetical predicted protein [Pelobates cultripes]|uniref:Uncharacterized protein n=1 Tax=Pelobates cultripes TaxID=61616 RepID=A0AAD1WG08_PELCU|nr:Hypothetical predicted protein [Pelobates cultripes]
MTIFREPFGETFHKVRAVESGTIRTFRSIPSPPRPRVHAAALHHFRERACCGLADVTFRRAHAPPPLRLSEEPPGDVTESNRERLRFVADC